MLRAAASARMASDFGESPWESPELAGDDSQADSVSTVPVRRPANAAPPGPDSIWTQASSLSFRSLGPKPKDISQLADLGQAVLQGPLAARWKRCDAKLGKLTHGSMQARPHSEPPERGGAAFCDDGRHELLESAASPSTKRPRYVLPTATPTKNRPLKRHHTTGSARVHPIHMCPECGYVDIAIDSDDAFVIWQPAPLAITSSSPTCIKCWAKGRPTPMLPMQW